MKNLQSVQAAYRFCQEVSARQLQFTNFCDWLTDKKHTSEYPQLIDWCKALRYIGTTNNVRTQLINTYRQGE